MEGMMTGLRSGWGRKTLVATGLILHLMGFAARGLLADELRGTTPNDFLRRGVPTFVIGTAGDERADREIRSQAELIRNLLFPQARIVTDDTIEVGRGPEAWPPNPILYGGPQANSVLAKLAGSLPFDLGPGKLVLGERTFEGDDYRLIAVVPARRPDRDGPGYPEFLLYAGTNSPGVAEINALRHGPEPILVADTFGRLLIGGWRPDGDGPAVPDFPIPPAGRIEWRRVDRGLRPDPDGADIAARFFFPTTVPAGEDEWRVVEACRRGLSLAARKLTISGPSRLSVYVYADRASKAALTGDRGDGHASPGTRSVHVVRFDPSAGGPLERLVAHEGTHVLAADAWGLAGTPLLGEGLAVWASGQYGGVPLRAWGRRLPGTTPPVGDLLGGEFRRLPEGRSYPLAGLFVEAAMGAVGLDAFREHLYGATAATWEAACRRAGTTPQELEATFRALLAVDPDPDAPSPP